MTKRWTTVLLGLGLLAPVKGSAQGRAAGSDSADASDYAQYISERKERTAQYLARRIASIEERAEEDARMRVQLKDERIGFERKLAQEESTFLDSLAAMPREARGNAWDAFHQKVRQERTDFSAHMRQESHAFWQTHRRTQGATPATTANAAPKAKPGRTRKGHARQASASRKRKQSA